MIKKAPKRDQSLSKVSIDSEYLSKKVLDAWHVADNDREELLERMQEYESTWRDMTDSSRRDGPFAGSADFKSRLPLSYGKAVHARLWQLFSNPNGFFSAKSRQEAFKEKEIKIQHFMNWVLERFSNSRNGCRRELDRWLWDVVFNGSGYLKVYWKREEHEYKDVVLEREVEELPFDELDITGISSFTEKFVERERVQNDVVETPQIRRILFEDVLLPPGQQDPQESDWVLTRIFMSDDDLKLKAQEGKFFKEAVENSLGKKENIFNGNSVSFEIKQDRQNIDGNESTFSDTGRVHVILEYYGKAWVEEKEVDQDDNEKEINKTQKEIVAWVHSKSREVLGWTYLHRVSAGGTRPIFKADYVSFPDRSYGVGVPELIHDLTMHTEAIRNLRMDNGILASNPMGFYRSSTSGLKPDVHRMGPGDMIPVDDPSDIRLTNFPFLSGFGYQEEGMLKSDIQQLLALSELQMGGIPEKVGALRNATGSNLIAQESSIQLQIHFDRIASCTSKMLQFLFKLCRERMPSRLYYRVESDMGAPVFGEVNREDLKGDYDFDIALDIMNQSQQERQQQSVLMMQTLLNGAFLQTGVITPKNIFAMAKNFLITHKVSRVDEFLTTPPDYEGEQITASERIFRIVAGRIVNPNIEDTVRLSENHKQALETYEAFENSDEFGLIVQDAQLAAWKILKEKHLQMLQAQQAGGMINTTGLQMPNNSPNSAAVAPGGSPLQPEVAGEANGPVV